MSEIIEQALGLYTEQFRESEHLLKFTRALLAPFAELEDALNELLTLRSIDQSFGKQLDIIGEIIGVERQGRDDVAYRDALKFQTFINTSKCEPETIITATRTLSEGNLIRYWENYPAGYQIFTDGPHVTDVGGGFIDFFLLGLDDGGVLILQDGANLIFRTSETPPQGLAKFLRSITGAAINTIGVTFSEGEVPLFGFGGDFLSVTFALDDGGLFILDDGSTLDAYVDEVTPGNDGFTGFSEFLFQKLVLDDGGDLAISSNTLAPLLTQLAVEGIADNSTTDLLLYQPAFTVGALDFILEDGATLFFNDGTYLVLQGYYEYSLPLLTDDDGGLELDDGGPFHISSLGEVLSLLESDDGGYIISDDGGPIVVQRLEDDRIYCSYITENGPFGLAWYEGTAGSGILTLHDGAELQLNIFAVLDEQSILLVLDQNQTPVDGGKLAEGITDAA